MAAAGTDRAGALTRGITVGALGGMAGGMAMAMYAMAVSATVKDVGFFTPLFHIAASVSSGDALMRSMGRAAEGDQLTFVLGPALVGLVVHLMTGAVAGALFGAAVLGRGLSRSVTVMAGTAFGLLVLVANAFVGLPAVARLLGGGDPVRDMAEMVGWGTFTVEHGMFGTVLGLVVAATAPVRTPVLAARTA
jgi:hypothetical protein